MKISDTKKLAAITAAFFLTVTAFPGCSESANSSQTTSSVSQAAKSDIDASIAAEDIDVGYDEESSVGITFSAVRVRPLRGKLLPFRRQALTFFQARRPTAG